jgi:hypothetical protein
VWQAFQDTDDRTAYRTVLNGYLVFLQERDGLWLVSILMPEDERQKTFFPARGFKRGVPLEDAQQLAQDVTRDARTRLERKQKNLERQAKKKRS